jgi:hypothetical protein
MANVKLEKAILVVMGAATLLELEPFYEFVDDSRDAFLCHRRERGSGLGMRILEYDPQAGAVALVIARADGASELREFEGQRSRVSEIEIGVFRRILLKRRMSEEIYEDAAGVVDQVAESLRDEYGVHVAGRGLFELVKVVVWEGIFKRDFDGSRGPSCVRRDADGHEDYSFTPHPLFRVGAAGEDGEGAVELFGEHDAGEFVRVGHGAERKLLVGA